MKIIYLIATGFVLVTAYKNQIKETPGTSQRTDTPSVTPTTPAPSVAPATVTPQANAPTAFDINSIPVSDKLTGTFPYFKLPDGYVFSDPGSYGGTGKIRDYDKEYFVIHGSYWPVEGKTYKASIRVDEKAKDKVFSNLELQKSFDDIIEQLGGVKLNNGDELKEEEGKKLEANAYQRGYTYSCNNHDNLHTYVIRKSDKVIWVQYNINSNDVAITVLETSSFKNDMSIQAANEIKQQLDEHGKAILYINFDTDKATLKPDGNDAVAEIAKVLQQASTLKLSIEGYTDNTGTAEHNKQLSIERAQTVRNSLIAKGINGANLKAVGYGADKPLADNNNEENKAKNRRVELVKI